MPYSYFSVLDNSCLFDLEAYRFTVTSFLGDLSKEKEGDCLCLYYQHINFVGGVRREICLDIQLYSIKQPVSCVFRPLQGHGASLDLKCKAV